MDWCKITDNEEVKKLLKERFDIEQKIRNIDPNALINYELLYLGLID